MTKDAKSALTTTQNTIRNRSYVISIIQEIIFAKQNFLFSLRYIPDKVLLEHGCLGDYLTQLLSHGSGNDTPERLAHHILEDIVDQTIPKWIEVSLMQKNNSHGQNITVTAEDRQPNWDDDDIIKRLSPAFYGS